MSKFNRQTTSNDVNRGKEVESHRIYRYEDLSFGKLCSVNRDIKQPHVRKILRGLENGTWHRLGIIYVDKETREIVDGNHRYLALSKYIDKYGSFKGHKIDIVYYDRPATETLADAVKFFNDDRKALMTKDYAKIAEHNGNQAVIKIRNFGLTHELTAKRDKEGNIIKDESNNIIDYSERYAYSFIYGKNVTKEVRDGSIKITDEQLAQAEMLYKEVEQMLKGCELNIKAWLEPFVQGWYELRINNRLFQNQFNKIDFTDFCDQIAEDYKEWSMDKTKKSDWIKRFSESLSYVIE